MADQTKTDLDTCDCGCAPVQPIQAPIQEAAEDSCECGCDSMTKDEQPTTGYWKKYNSGDGMLIFS